MDSRTKGTQQSLQDLSLDQLLDRLHASREGLSPDEARRRLEQYGPNELAEKRASPILILLGYFWGPIPWMIEVAAILSAIVRHWADLAIIGVLLVVNAVVGFWEEHQASNTMAIGARLLARSEAIVARPAASTRYG